MSESDDESINERQRGNRRNNIPIDSYEEDEPRRNLASSYSNNPRIREPSARSNFRSQEPNEYDLPIRQRNVDRSTSRSRFERPQNDYAKYDRMRNMGIPNDAVRFEMTRDRFPQADMMGYLNRDVPSSGRSQYAPAFRPHPAAAPRRRSSGLTPDILSSLRSERRPSRLPRQRPAYDDDLAWRGRADQRAPPMISRNPRRLYRDERAPPAPRRYHDESLVDDEPSWRGRRDERAAPYRPREVRPSYRDSRAAPAPRRYREDMYRDQESFAVDDEMSWRGRSDDRAAPRPRDPRRTYRDDRAAPARRSFRAEKVYDDEDLYEEQDVPRSPREGRRPFREERQAVSPRSGRAYQDEFESEADVDEVLRNLEDEDMSASDRGEDYIPSRGVPRQISARKGEYNAPSRGIARSKSRRFEYDDYEDELTTQAFSYADPDSNVEESSAYIPSDLKYSNKPLSKSSTAVVKEEINTEAFFKEEPPIQEISTEAFFEKVEVPKPSEEETPPVAEEKVDENLSEQVEEEVSSDPIIEIVPVEETTPEVIEEEVSSDPIIESAPVEETTPEVIEEEVSSDPIIESAPIDRPIAQESSTTAVKIKELPEDDSQAGSMYGESSVEPEPEPEFMTAGFSVVARPVEDFSVDPVHVFDYSLEVNSEAAFVRTSPAEELSCSSMYGESSVEPSPVNEMLTDAYLCFEWIDDEVTVDALIECHDIDDVDTEAVFFIKYTDKEVDCDAFYEEEPPPIDELALHACFVKAAIDDEVDVDAFIELCRDEVNTEACIFKDLVDFEPFTLGMYGESTVEPTILDEFDIPAVFCTHEISEYPLTEAVQFWKDPRPEIDADALYEDLSGAVAEFMTKAFSMLENSEQEIMTEAVSIAEAISDELGVDWLLEEKKLHDEINTESLRCIDEVVDEVNTESTNLLQFSKIDEGNNIDAHYEETPVFDEINTEAIKCGEEMDEEFNTKAVFLREAPDDEIVTDSAYDKMDFVPDYDELWVDSLYEEGDPDFFEPVMEWAEQDFEELYEEGDADVEPLFEEGYPDYIEPINEYFEPDVEAVFEFDEVDVEPEYEEYDYPEVVPEFEWDSPDVDAEMEILEVDDYSVTYEEERDDPVIYAYSFYKTKVFDEINSDGVICLEGVDDTLEVTSESCHYTKLPIDLPITSAVQIIEIEVDETAMFGMYGEKSVEPYPTPEETTVAVCIREHPQVYEVDVEPFYDEMLVVDEAYSEAVCYSEKPELHTTVDPILEGNYLDIDSFMIKSRPEPEVMTDALTILSKIIDDFNTEAIFYTRDVYDDYNSAGIFVLEDPVDEFLTEAGRSYNVVTLPPPRAITTDVKPSLLSNKNSEFVKTLLENSLRLKKKEYAEQAYLDPSGFQARMQQKKDAEIRSAQKLVHFLNVGETFVNRRPMSTSILMRSPRPGKDVPVVIVDEEHLEASKRLSTFSGDFSNALRRTPKPVIDAPMKDTSKPAPFALSEAALRNQALAQSLLEKHLSMKEDPEYAYSPRASYLSRKKSHLSQLGSFYSIPFPVSLNISSSILKTTREKEQNDMVDLELAEGRKSTFQGDFESELLKPSTARGNEIDDIKRMSFHKLKGLENIVGKDSRNFKYFSKIMKKQLENKKRLQEKLSQLPPGELDRRLAAKEELTKHEVMKVAHYSRLGTTFVDRNALLRPKFTTAALWPRKELPADSRLSPLDAVRERANLNLNKALEKTSKTRATIQGLRGDRGQVGTVIDDTPMRSTDSTSAVSDTAEPVSPSSVDRFAVYRNLLRMKFSNECVRERMARDGFTKREVESFFDPFTLTAKMEQKAQNLTLAMDRLLEETTPKPRRHSVRAAAAAAGSRGLGSAGANKVLLTHMASRKDYDDVQQLMKQPPKSFLSKLASLFFFSKHSEGPRDDSKLQTPRSKQTYFGAFLNFATSWLSIFGSKPKSSHQPMQSSADTLNPVSPLLVAVRVGV